MSTTWPLAGPAGACSGTSDTAAGSWRASRRPEWPFLAARYTFRGGLPGRETAAHSLQSDQGGAAAAVSTEGKIGSAEAVRPDTRSARGELMESPRSCPTRLCRTEGSAQHSVETPPGWPDRASPSEPPGPAEYSGAGLATGGGVNHLRARRGGEVLVEHKGACRIAGIGVPPCMRQRRVMRLVWSCLWSTRGYAESDGKTAFMRAARNGHAEAVNLLAEREGHEDYS